MNALFLLLTYFCLSVCAVHIPINEQLIDDHSYHTMKYDRNITIQDGPLACFDCINGPGSVIYYGGEALCFVGVGVMGVNINGAYRIAAVDRWMKITLIDLFSVTIQPGWIHWFDTPHTIIKVERWQ